MPRKKQNPTQKIPTKYNNNNNNVNKDDKKQIPPTYTENDEKKQMIVIPDEISSNNNELYELYFNEPTFGPLFHVPCINSNDNKSYEPFFKFNIYAKNQQQYTKTDKLFICMMSNGGSTENLSSSSTTTTTTTTMTTTTKTNTIKINNEYPIISASMQNEMNYLHFFHANNINLLSKLIKANIITFSINDTVTSLIINISTNCIIFEGKNKRFDVYPPILRKNQKLISEFMIFLNTSIKKTPRQPPRPPSKKKQKVTSFFNNNATITNMVIPSAITTTATTTTTNNNNSVRGNNDDISVYSTAANRSLFTTNDNDIMTTTTSSTTNNTKKKKKRKNRNYNDNNNNTTMMNNNNTNNTFIINNSQPISRIEILNDLIEKSTLRRRKKNLLYKRTMIDDNNNFQPKELTCTLRPYQIDAVKWAVERERQPIYKVNEFYGMKLVPNNITTNEQQQLYYNKFNGMLVNMSTPIQEKEEKHNQNIYNTLRGGILADEMGLGKTIETISLVLLNKAPKEYNTQIVSPSSVERVSRLKQHNGNYSWSHEMECMCGIQHDNGKETGICSTCGIKVHIECQGGHDLWKRSNEQCLVCVSKTEFYINSSATLIICPHAIVSQWEEEIKRHIIIDDDDDNNKSLKIYTYLGVQEETGNHRKHVKKMQKKKMMKRQGDSDNTDNSYNNNNNNNTISNNENETNEEKPDIFHPLQFENYDIILTTYGVLRKELSHANIIKRRSRHKKKYPAIPSPLVSIKWWRICLDEAQMVESSTAKAAEMVSTLATEHRWGISGTPFVKGSGLDDLYGLLLFLRVNPFGTSRSWYRHAIQIPCEHGDKDAKEYLYDLLDKIMWRSAKKDVQNEINVPPQNEITYRLKFSATERHFYNLQKKECYQVAHKILQATEDLSKVIDENAIHKIAIPLLRLRQACCHPQVGSFGITPLHAKTPMPMNKILSLLIDKAKDDCNKKIKDQVLYMSGLAALANIEKKEILAMQKYTEILLFIDKEEQLYKIDKFQRLHCFHNLHQTADKYIRSHPHVKEEVLNLYKPINELKALANDLRNKEEAIQANRVSHMKYELENITKNVLESDRQAHEMRKIRLSFGGNSDNNKKKDVVNSSASSSASSSSSSASSSSSSLASSSSSSSLQTRTRPPWYQRSLDKIYHNVRLKTNFIASFRAILSSADQANIILWQAPRSAIGMGQVIGTKLDQLQESRENIINYLNQHVGIPTRAEVRERGNCRKCSSLFNRTGKVCFHCHAEDELFKYNRMIFSYRVTRGGDQNDINVNSGTFRQEAVLFKVLRKIGALSKYSASIKKEVKINLESFELLKRECKAAQLLHSAISQRLAYLDELDTCTNCVSLRLPGEVVSEEDAAWRILEQQVPVMKEEDEINVIAAKAELDKARSQLKYLMNVQAEETGIVSAGIHSSGNNNNDNNNMKKNNGSSNNFSSSGGGGSGSGGNDNGSSSSSSGSSSSSKSGSSNDNDRSTIINLTESTNNDHDQNTNMMMMVDNDNNNNNNNNNNKNTERNNRCSICLGTFGTSEVAKRVMLSCAHIYCYTCIKRLIGNRKTGNLKCPGCRQISLIENIQNIDDNKKDIEMVVNNNNTIIDDNSNININHGSSSITNNHRDNNNNNNNKITGSYGTKIERVLKCAIDILDKNPENKMLIFSKWEDVLDITEKAFVENDISNVRLGTGKKLHITLSKFKNDPYVSCLFLPLKSGANGLNLIEATHVLLIDPIISKSVEAQAVGRVHRIGQTKETFIHRFIVEDTIEERIDTLQKRKMVSNQRRANNTKSDARLTGEELRDLFA